ncbi:dihydrodipicolinate synthase family protein [Nitriliruptor alkaliphilus]|uniref:dihydrodipicolinate synthase family protein n=1 Tax=Nitriliruptor alkaliphilus TaxID=427918 RepID=UPI0009F8F708|nr:dihydrodipicolinate synthase family protein [Nitriliruptor alkaliphilus]
MTVSVRLPGVDGRSVDHTMAEPRYLGAAGARFTSRIAYAAAHVVAEPLGHNAPGAPAAVDWDATLRFRHHLWNHGFGVAEAMDTAQRGMGLDWQATQQLIRRSAAEAHAVGGQIAAGAGTDHLEAGERDLDTITTGYLTQLEVVEDSGARPILMASRQLAAAAGGPDDYHRIYGRILEVSSTPVVLHWLGPMFDPALAGYWGSGDLEEATDSFVALCADHAARIDGVKVSLLDADHEIALRRRLPDTVRCYTGDDFNYPELIRGDDTGHSDALLGIFAAIAPAAATALAALDRGDLEVYEEVFSRTVPLARHVFAVPTFHYKTGIAFLAWLSGHQDGFTMVAGQQAGRSVPDLVTTFRLADAAGLLPDPSLAAHRMTSFLEVAGVTP